MHYNCLTLRFVIATVCAMSVVIVAALSLAVTYTVAVQTLRSVGSQYASQIAQVAQVRTENFFLLPASACTATAGLYLQSGWVTPRDDPTSPDPRLHDKFWHTFYSYMIMTNLSCVSMATIFDDGSGNSMFYFAPDVLAMVARNALAWPAGPMQLATYGVNLTTGRTCNDTHACAAHGQVLNVTKDHRFPAYYTAKGLFGTDRRGVWYPVSLQEVRPGFIVFVLPVAIPLWNNTGQYIGVALAAQEITAVQTVLRNAKATPNTEAFAIEASGIILASSHASEFYTLKNYTNPPRNLKSGCATSSDTESLTKLTWVGCRTAAADFTAYPPLMAVAGRMPELFTTTQVTVSMLSVDTDSYFVAAAPVRNPFRFWGLNVVLVLPERDIIGDVTVSRNTAIAITVSLAVVTACICVVVVSVMLKPLTMLSINMRQTAKLHEVDNQQEDEMSAMAEIRDLQTAYANMNTAIKNFTRYVPRDVVKDLMRAGNLCEISMTPQRCTVFFADIENFTGTCERVPPMVLSQLVSQYFDRASRIIMAHDGLIDKFIGDCIMSVWGAPFATSHQEVKATLVAKLLDRETLVEPLATTWDEAGEQLRVRVGISSGEVLAGNMGSADRMNYTVIGDVVNLAARLESMNKQFGTRVMVCEATAAALRSVFVLRLLLPITVVGKEVPVKVYEVMGIAQAIPADEVEELSAAANALYDESGSTKSESVASVGSDARPKTKSTLALVLLRAATFPAFGVNKPLALPALCSDDGETQFARQYTDAVWLYLCKDFVGALAAFAELAAVHGPRHYNHDATSGGDSIRQRSSTAETSIALMDRLCHEALTSTTRSTSAFDGVYRAVDK